MTPTEKVGAVNIAINRLLEENPEHCAVVEHEIGSSGAIGKFFECCGRKVSFSASVKQAAEIYTRIYENYGDRARLAQSNEGVDWKALSHAVRVGHEAVELLTTQRVTLPLPEDVRRYVLDVKSGRLEYNAVADRIEQLLAEVEEAAKSSRLPDEPDIEFIEDTIINAYSNRVHDEVCRREHCL